ADRDVLAPDPRPHRAAGARRASQAVAQRPAPPLPRGRRGLPVGAHDQRPRTGLAALVRSGFHGAAAAAHWRIVVFFVGGGCCVKTYKIEMNKVKAMSNGNGLIQAKIDA